MILASFPGSTSQMIIMSIVCYCTHVASLKQMGYSRKYVNSPYNNVLLQCTVYIHTIVQSWKLAEQSTLTEAPF